MKRFVKGQLDRLGYRLERTASEEFPVGDLAWFCRRLAQQGFVPRNVIDVGAHEAAWSRELARVFPEAVFTLIEPQAHLGPRLQEFCLAHPGSRWIQAGAGSEMGVKAFHRDEDDPTASTFDLTAAEEERHRDTVVELPIVTLDHVCSEIVGAIPEVVKLDAEGLEYEILKGATSLVGTVELFLVELHLFPLRPSAPPFDAFVAIMADLGYKPYDFTWFMRRPLDGALALCEVAFARENGFLRASTAWD